MKRSKGFTLVELLAVIVILAIILAIAIPSITNVVNSSRLSSFAVSSKMLERAAKTYLSVNNTAVASGTTSYILYSDMKSAGYINKVVDPQSNTECTHSGVYVTNNSGTYTYKGALACDKYMDIDAYNLVTNSDFSNGTTGWIGDGSTISRNGNILSSTGNGTNNYPYFTYLGNLVIGHKYYIRIKLRVTNNLCTNMEFKLDNNNTINFINSPLQNQWYTNTAIITTTTTTMTYRIHHSYVDNATANGKVIEVDGTTGVYALDLTAIYGAGNESTKTQMDTIMSNMGK